MCMDVDLDLLILTGLKILAFCLLLLKHILPNCVFKLVAIEN